MFICVAEDRIGHCQLTLAERYCVAACGKTEKWQKHKDLPWEIELAKWMKVLVTDNVEMDLNVTNGARGRIVDIMLHPEEPAIGNEPIVWLKYIPAYILVKLAHTQASRLEGLDKAVIPVEVASTTMQITVQVNGKWIKCTICRRQFPITATYVFTDYQSQGQTLPYILVDIASLPCGMITLFNLYVALSRSLGQSGFSRISTRTYSCNIMTWH